MLQIENLTFDAWGRRFFDRASVMIPAGTKVGLVGRNGVGKSTLFKLITGELASQEGDVVLPKTARIGSVDQEHPATPVTLLDTVLAADTEREELNAQLETAEPEQLAEIYQHLNAIDADRAPARAAEILSGLGFSNSDLDRPMAEFSGGWRMRVALAAALFAEPHLLLLDQLSRSRRRAVARSPSQGLPADSPHHQPRSRASEQFGRCHPASDRRPARFLYWRLRRFRTAAG
jgi:ATP-binding cassette subfamily F protein 3